MFLQTKLKNSQNFDHEVAQFYKNPEHFVKRELEKLEKTFYGMTPAACVNSKNSKTLGRKTIVFVDRPVLFEFVRWHVLWAKLEKLE